MELKSLKECLQAIDNIILCNVNTCSQCNKYLRAIRQFLLNEIEYIREEEEFLLSAIQEPVLEDDEYDDADVS